MPIECGPFSWTIDIVLLLALEQIAAKLPSSRMSLDYQPFM